MDHLFDEFSKSLAESVPRRESLRRLGAVFAGAVLSPLAVGTAWAGRNQRRVTDPCKAFCQCRNSTKQSKCLAACRACGGDTSRLAGSCGSYTCCAVASCNGVCSNLSSDPNCGACGNNCSALGLTCCGNDCADLDWDAENCGACGVVCPYGELCSEGACVPANCGSNTYCPVVWPGGGPGCTDLQSDSYNCGACGHFCFLCVDGMCAGGPPSD